MDIEWERDYFWQNKKSLRSIFSRYNQWDIMWWFAEKWVNIVEEDRGRLILESWDSKELLRVLIASAQENNSEIFTEKNVINITQKNDEYIVSTENWEKYFSKYVIVSSGGKSFFQVWTTWEWYSLAQKFWLNIIPPTRALWWLSTKKDLSAISWSSCVLSLEVYDNNSKKRSPFYQETGPLLFTHFWVSGPIIFNAWNAIGEHISSLWLDISGKDFHQIDELYEHYLREHISLQLTFTPENSPKKVVSFFWLNEMLNKHGTQVSNYVHTLDLQNWRSWKEAKATGGWVDINELDKYLQVKNQSWLFFIWEVCDITWKTWGFNLQWAWSSAFCCSELFENTI
jgi:predicted Rossmann fold flavoprotein